MLTGVLPVPCHRGLGAHWERRGCCGGNQVSRPGGGQLQGVGDRDQPREGPMSWEASRGRGVGLGVMAGLAAGLNVVGEKAEVGF